MTFFHFIFESVVGAFLSRTRGFGSRKLPRGVSFLFGDYQLPRFLFSAVPVQIAGCVTAEHGQKPREQQIWCCWPHRISSITALSRAP